jgi:hypothetical protein
MAEILLLYPPVSRPCEAPAGIARLKAHLARAGITAAVCDLNLAGLEFLCRQPRPAGVDDTWSRRAFRQAANHLDFLRSSAGYRNFARYQRAVSDLNRVVDRLGRRSGLDLSLVDYQEPSRSPLSSPDLLAAAANFSDSLYYPLFEKLLSPLIERETPAWIGISLNYLSQALSAFALVGFCRARFPEIRIIIGGGLATSWRARPDWRGECGPFAGLIDHFPAGPGERFLVRLLRPERAENGLAEGFSPAGGFDDFTLSGYLAPGFILPCAASSGCYWNRCSFCPERAENNPFRGLPPATAVSEINAMVSRRAPVLVHFLDNALSPALLAEIIRRPPGAPWYGFVRADAGLEDPDFCRGLAVSGCVMLKLGLESGSARVLEEMGKGLTPERAGRVLENLKKAGITTYVYLLFGTPAEDLAAARQTLEFVARHHQAIGFLNLAIFNLPRFSPESRGLETSPAGREDLSLYADFRHPLGFGRRAVRRFLDREFRRHPAIAPVLRRDPPLFTSSHAPFFRS